MSEDYLEKLITTPRAVGLAANRAGDVVLTVNSLSDDGSRYRPRLYSLATPSTESEVVPLTAPESGAGLQAIGEDGSIYLTLDKPVDGAENTSLTGLYRLSSRGEPQLEFTFPGDIHHLEARGTGSGRNLVFTAQALGDNLDEAAKILERRAKEKVSGVLHEDFPTRFWDHDDPLGERALFVKETGKEPRRVRLPEGRLVDFTLGPTGRRALVTIERKLHGVYQRADVYYIDLFERGEPRLIAEADDRVSFGAGDFSPSGTHAMIFKTHVWLSDQSLNSELNVVELATGEMTRLAASIDRWPNDVCWIDDKTLAMTTDHLGAGAVWRVGLDDSVTQLTDDGYHYSALQFSGGGLVALRDAHNVSPHPVRLSATSVGMATVRELTSPIEPLRAPGRLEKLSVTARDGAELTAWLALPEHSSEPAPLAVFAHGGPWGSWNSWTYRWNPWVLTEAGYAVLLPDPGISTGYGQAMIDRGGHSVGAEPYFDIMDCIEHVSARDDVDGESAAFMGGSYGGYMTNWVAGHAGTRFKCYVSHASIWNQGHMYTTTDNGSWQQWMAEGPDAVHDTFSPHQFADQIQAPMLVIHGDKDYRVPISQAHMLWFDLKRYSPQLDHKYLYFPDEGHWITKPGNSRLWYQTVLAYLNTHVRGERFEAPELLG
ncbi:prolyl oligopeptidase family serine peptidase [Rothia sp. LK2588]|uniref:S9 family peptidase n=1 Tax=Rothia sp. LK2588 TaxID=3114369 RepID=UPI0034CD30DC